VKDLNWPQVVFDIKRSCSKEFLITSIPSVKIPATLTCIWCCIYYDSRPHDLLLRTTKMSKHDKVWHLGEICTFATWIYCDIFQPGNHNVHWAEFHKLKTGIDADGIWSTIMSNFEVKDPMEKISWIKYKTFSKVIPCSILKDTKVGRFAQQMKKENLMNDWVTRFTKFGRAQIKDDSLVN